MALRTSAARTRPGSLLLFALLLTSPACAVAQAPAASPAATGSPDSVFWAGLRWRSIGPANMGGRITDIEGLPSPSKTFYVAAAAGGIWKTTNNGITFRPVFDDQRVISMGDIAIAPATPVSSGRVAARRIRATRFRPAAASTSLPTGG